MTLAIGHRSVEGRGVLDHLVERRPPFSPQNVINEFAEALKAYRVSKVVGDRWGGEFVREPLRGHGIEYELAEKAKSEWYRDALPIFTSSKAELLDHSRLVAQFCQLERRTARGGRDSIDHPPGGHDDLCNVVAMVLVLAAGGPQPIDWKTIGPKVIAESYANPYRRAHVFADRAEAIARNPFALGERGTAQARRARGY